MIDEATLKPFLDKIFSSKEFLNSKTDQVFLSYLVNASLRGETPKELTIAIDVFKKTADFNPADDSTVRTHIYHLRKKLDTYYLTEGKDDKVRLKLEKGQYKIDFVSSKRNYKVIKKTVQHLPFIYTLLIILLIALSIYLWRGTISLKKQIQQLYPVSYENIIWSDFLNSDLKTIIVIGDYFYYQEKQGTADRERYIRDVGINSAEDLAEYLVEHPDKKETIYETKLTYLGREVPWALKSLYSIFTGNEEKITLKLASEVDWQDVRRNNLIFIGNFRTLRIMNHFFKNLRYKIDLYPKKLYYTPTYTDTLETLSFASQDRYGFHKDYAIVAKFPGGNNNTILMFTSFSSFGKIDAVKTLTDPDFPQEVLANQVNKLDKVPPYFEVLFRLYGVAQTGFRTEILHFNEIDPQHFLEEKSLQ